MMKYYNILKDSKFFSDFIDKEFLYKIDGKLVSNVKEFKNNVIRISKNITDLDSRKKYLGDVWEFFSLFYMIYESSLLCKNSNGDKKKFKVNNVVSVEADFGTDFYISHNGDVISVQCKWKSGIDDLDPVSSKLSNFIQDSREKTNSKYYILITTNELKYTIKDLLVDDCNFYFITLEDIEKYNYGIDIFKDFENCIDNIKSDIKINVPEVNISLDNFQPKYTDKFKRDKTLDFSISKIPNKIFETNSTDIQHIISIYILSKFFRYLGNIRYDIETDLLYINSSKYNITFVILYNNTQNKKISANQSNLSKYLTIMDDTFEQESKILYLSNVDDLFDITLENMSRNKVSTVINYYKLFKDYNLYNDFNDFISMFINYK